jgi:adenosine deaminase
MNSAQISSPPTPTRSTPTPRNGPPRALHEQKRAKLNEAFLLSLPKTDLHVHLDGSLRIETMLELAEQQKVKLPAHDPDKLRELVVQTPEKCDSLVNYLKAFDITLSVLQEADALSRAAYELAEDCAKENVRYFEVRFSPILHQKRGLSLARIVQSVIDGLSLAEKEFGIRSGVIICGIRSMDPMVSVRLAELTIAFKDRGVLAFDLAGGEFDNPAKDHQIAFNLILSNNINCTVHAGESYGPASIHQAIHACGAHRIGHGTRLREDGSLLNYVNDHRIPIECCITSNVQTHTVDSYESHPIRDYYDYGLRVTVNTDNRLISDTTVTRELLICVEKLGFDAEGINRLLINGFKSSFLPYREKRAILLEVIRELDEKFGEPMPTYP